MSFVIIIIASCLLGDLLIWAVGAAKLRRRRASGWFRIVFHLFMLAETVALAGMVFGRSRGINIDDYLPQFALILIYIWHLLLLPAALALTLAGGVMRVSRKAVALLLRPAEPPTISPLLMRGRPISRREFFGTAMVLAGPLLTLGLGTAGANQLSRFRIRRMTLRLPQLPRALEGLTIVQLTDTHVGRFTHGPVLGRMVEATNELKPDLVVFTGDLLNDSLNWLPEAARMLEEVEAPVILCEGNHDLFMDAPLFRKTMKETPGVTALFNESVVREIRGEPVQFLGLRWGGPPGWKGPRHDERGIAASVEELLAQRDPVAFPILLAHHPHAWDYAPGIPLTFAGHTHGGQFMLNERMGVGPAMFRYWSGLYTRPVAAPAATEPPEEALIVSNGSGNWFPLRIEAPAEIIHVTLTR